ncbi:CpsD/CapB family tyrosine-protein kinase [Paenibacillus peoriae]|uniref:CpsD/CapB family tyrosine-protein kinase n=1 Tax=Paenibacillus peoriae TaxID=59893 RepID=UPI00026C5E12|nr:CpsD/CapB family tyrosine-protein kinase [Paenibacillus peoriae]MEC0180263.1 CpsD/CapB family tyrosine-protein kinase [Paenibacillus peoriae]
MPRLINNQLVTSLHAQSFVSEEYRMLRTNIQFSSVDEPIEVMMVASAQAGEGRTVTISNLAVTYAQEGKKVLVMDMDLRRSSLHHMFGLLNHTGLTRVLANQQAWQDVVQETGIDQLHAITAGPNPPNPSEMLSSRKMKALLVELKEHYDVILMDTPPLLSFPDGLIVSAMCDGVILVVQAGKVKKDVVKKAKAHLERVKARILGVVLNNVKRPNTRAQRGIEERSLT